MLSIRTEPTPFGESGVRSLESHTVLRADNELVCQLGLFRGMSRLCLRSCRDGTPLSSWGPAPLQRHGLARVSPVGSVCLARNRTLLSGIPLLPCSEDPPECGFGLQLLSSCSGCVTSCLARGTLIWPNAQAASVQTFRVVPVPPLGRCPAGLCVWPPRSALLGLCLPTLWPWP